MTVRKTLDLTPQANRALAHWQLDTADELGIGRVTFQELGAALVEVLVTDDATSKRVIALMQRDAAS